MRTLLCLLALVGGCGLHETHVSARPSQEKSGILCVLENEAVTESSGVAISRRVHGVYWTHNDSGDGPNLYAFDAKGANLGTYTLMGVQAIDWEDMASAVIGEKPYLFVGDVGDNGRTRKTIFVYRIPEPDIVRGKTVLTLFQKFELKYPDGAHDCEALLVTPAGDIQLVTKSQSGTAGVYQAKLESQARTIELKKIGELKIEHASPFARMVTAADMSPDGRRVVVRTYASAYLYEGSPSDWFKKEPKEVPVPFQQQSEAICFDFDPSRVITTSEGKPCQVLWTRLP